MKPGGGIDSTSRFSSSGSLQGLLWVPPKGNVVHVERPYFCFLGVFAFSVLIFRFDVFPGGTQPQPQFNFLVIMSPPFVLSVFAASDRRHPQMHRLAKSGGRRYNWKLFSAIFTIRSWSFFLPS